METQNQNIKSLIADIRDRIGRPVSNRVVMATIESLGIRNKDTESDYGIPSLYELSDLIYYELTTSPEHVGAKNLKEQEALLSGPKTVQVSDYLWVKTKIFLEYYPKGILHLLPVILQIACIIIFGYSLWTFVGFNHVQSTAVVLGVIVGLVTTAGFVQVIGRQASFYWNHEDYTMVHQTVNYMLRIGSKSILAVLTVIFFSNFFLHLYPFGVLFIAFAYALLIGLLVLLLAPLHTVNQRWVISLAISFATLVAILLKTYTALPIYATHWIGISVAIVITKGFLEIFFKRLISKKSAKSNLRIRPTVLFYNNYRYFLYGLMLYIFVFIDRILAWSTTKGGQTQPFVVYFDKDYELGMDLAIVVFLLLSGVLEYSIASFARFMDIAQKNTSYSKPGEFNQTLKKMYRGHIALLWITAAAVGWLVYSVITESWGYRGQFHEDLQQLSIQVCLIGGLGYVFLAWGMLNTLYMFTLDRPSAALKSIIIALVVNFTVGMLLSRFISYDYAVVGMASGAFVFMLLTLRKNIQFFNRLDYYYYAAY
jgi:hypothetical protein